MNKMSKRIKRMIAILVTVLMISQLPGVGYIISGAADDPVVPEPVGTLTYTCTAEDEGRTFSMFYQSLATLIVPEDLGVTIGAVEITDSVNVGASFTINNGGYIGTANFQYGDVFMNGGTYTSITLAEGTTINATGITATSSITSSGSFNVEGNNVSNGSVTAVSIGGTGNITVKGKLELTGSGTTAKMYVYADTQIINGTGATFTVNNVENNKEYNIPVGTSSTLREMYGVEVTYSSVDERVTCTEGSDQFNTPIWYGESTDIIMFTAAEGYYFPEGYQVTTEGKGTLTFNRDNESAVTVSYAIAEADSGEVTINLPALKKIPVDGVGTLTMNDVRYNETIDPQVTSATNDTTSPKYEYKQAEADDETYTTAKPIVVGDYVVRATLPANEEYNELVLEKEFSIIKAYGTVTFSVDDVVYGGEPKPQIASDTNDKTSAVVEYKISGAPDTAYTTTIPTTVGGYVSRVILAANNSYQQVEATTSFSIDKAEGNGTVSVNDIYYGASVSPELSSGTHNIYQALIEYKVAGADDSTYSSTVPTTVGNYTARVTYAENDSYNQVVVTDDFSISYLPAPTVEVAVAGTEGINGYYTTAVIVSAPEGFLISDKLDGDYSTSITLDGTREAGYFYYKNIQTGEKTAGVWCDEIMIDSALPTIAADDGAIYYAEFVEIAIRDSNLSHITVNGEEYLDISEGKATIKLESNNGLEKYEIVITDLAGNTKTMKVSVADNWMEQGVIPTGENVSLMTEYEYSLGEGTWQVEGDATSYSGNTTFYVGAEGEYTFMQK